MVAVINRCRKKKLIKLKFLGLDVASVVGPHIAVAIIVSDVWRGVIWFVGCVEGRRTEGNDAACGGDGTSVVCEADRSQEQWLVRLNSPVGPALGLLVGDWCGPHCTLSVLVLRRDQSVWGSWFNIPFVSLRLSLPEGNQTRDASLVCKIWTVQLADFTFLNLYLFSTGRYNHGLNLGIVCFKYWRAEALKKINVHNKFQDKMPLVCF